MELTWSISTITNQLFPVLFDRSPLVFFEFTECLHVQLSPSMVLTARQSITYEPELFSRPRSSELITAAGCFLLLHLLECFAELHLRNLPHGCSREFFSNDDVFRHLDAS